MIKQNEYFDQYINLVDNLLEANNKNKCILQNKIDNSILSNEKADLIQMAIKQINNLVEKSIRSFLEKTEIALFKIAICVCL